MDGPTLIDLPDWQYPQSLIGLHPNAFVDVTDIWEAGMGEADVLKALPQVFKSPGGKKNVALKLAHMLPPHLRYVEAFSGSAAVFWKKDPSPHEVLNDLRENLIPTFRYLRDTPDPWTPLSKKNWKPSRQQYDKLKAWKPTELVDKAYKYMWLSRCSLLNMADEKYSEDFARKNVHLPIQSRFNRWHERLQGVTLLEQDAVDVVKKYDSPYTAFYLDPPYPKGRDQHLYADHNYNMAQLGHLIDTCDGMQGKFLMSLNAASLPKEPLPKGMAVRKLAIVYNALPGVGKDGSKLSRLAHVRMEVLIHNYPIGGH